MKMQNARKRRTHKKAKRRVKQSGLALYLMLIFVILMNMHWLSAQLNGQLRHNKVERQQRLKFARENLIALSVNYMDNYGPTGAGPGHLPCPNFKIPDGSRSSFGPDTPCSGDHFVIGRLPRLVGIKHGLRVLNYQPDQYDAQNALWYIVSTSFVNSPFKKVNIESRGDLSFNGLQNVVAVVLDSGPALKTQLNMRPSSSFSAYLELQISSVEILTSPTSNDRYLAITLDDLLPLIVARVGATVAQWVLGYRDKYCSSGYTGIPCFPFASAHPDGVCSDGVLEGWLSVEAGECAHSLFDHSDLDQAPRGMHWFIRNRWFEQVHYKIDAVCLELPESCDVISMTVIYEGTVMPSLSIEPKV